jgi:ATP-dependent RNA helicase HelY
VAAALEHIKPGDVLVVPGGPSGGRVAVVSTARRKGGEVRLAGVTIGGQRLALTARDFPAPPRPVGKIALPVPYEPRSRPFLNAAAEALRAAKLRTDGLVGVAGTAEGATGQRGGRGAQALVSAAAAEAHPCAACPDLRTHVKAAERADRLEADAARLERSIRSRTESLARQFDRVLRVLEAWGYVAGWSLTASGERLARLYHECDLLVAEALDTGQLDDLDPAAVAALVSTFTYEARGPAGTGPTPWFPSRGFRERWQAIDHLAVELNRTEQEAGLPPTRRPDAGFVALAHSWAAGEPLAQVIADEEMSGGDFVRNVKQLIDLLRQIGDLAPDAATASAARLAADRVFRGVVAASSVIHTDAEEPELEAGTPGGASATGGASGSRS